MTTTSPRLVNWENGTDLVIELPLAVDVSAVWSKLTDREAAGSWFAPFTIEDRSRTDSTDQSGTDGEGSGADGDGQSGADVDGRSGADGEPGETIRFDLGETTLDGQVLSWEPDDHVLVELDDFGVLGVQLLEIPLTDGDATLLIFTQSAADVESARLKAADFGPMWDTHMRLFARTLGLEVVEADEAELLAIYADLELEDSATGGADEDGETRDVDEDDA
ncbi:hypothetical protein [Brevibacterium marinum]|uniref:Uncharacterized protein YndB with AHSA1/START domain n=1 Tax=Brevibacterium marinum TaxID=418643 RepID=A0A846S3B3_9MICO|nr:hypothetical protein [Brevibacterium marinum]NJC56631.1 uncharacterized protein YndB with AHSA1/START domain [Brevibacterium marinum]